MYRISNFIDGRALDPISGKFLENFDPAVGEIYSELPDSDERDINLAVDAASKAFPAWSKMSQNDRSKILFRLADLIEENLENLARSETLDTGKPVHFSRTVDIPRAALNFRFFASAGMQFSSEAHTNFDSVNFTRRDPLGVVGCISPWNLPLYLLTWKIAPALAVGNTVVAKPSEITPTTAFELGELAQKSGLPAGVLNIVQGLGNKVGKALVAHPKVKAISFTGGTATGVEIAKNSAPHFKKISLELGGKNPVFVFADCDFHQMLDTVVRSSFSNQGQICLCGSRIYIEASIYEKFKAEFLKKVQHLKVGDPREEKTDQGALSSKQHLEKISSFVEIARHEGGKILVGGKRAIVPGRCEKGWFFEPTVIEGLSHECRVNQEEIFGPLVTLSPFYSDEDVVRFANSTRYGLATSLWSENISRCMNLSRDIESGIVWINTWMLRDLRTPFGGMKDSGFGREGGNEALRFFTETKNICIRYD